jgi:Uncharacterized protein family UPF0004
MSTQLGGPAKPPLLVPGGAHHRTLFRGVARAKPLPPAFPSPCDALSLGFADRLTSLAVLDTRNFPFPQQSPICCILYLSRTRGLMGEAEDIEDVACIDDIEDLEDFPSSELDGIRHFRALPQAVSFQPVKRAVPCGSDSASLVPGTQAVWVKTFGCAHNTSDSEYIAGQLQEYGYRYGATGLCL